MRTRYQWLFILALPAFLATPAAAVTAFTFTAADQGAVTALDVVSAFATTVRNTGDATDTYTVTLVKDLPGAWSCSLCQGTICYPPFVQQISFSLAPGGETNVDVDLTPQVVEGAGAATVTVTSQSQPSLSLARDFRVVTTGVEVLLVDGDGGRTLEDFYAPALAASGLGWARWPRHEAGALGSLELAGFSAVIWFADGVSPGLDDPDRAALAYYVQHGGFLLLSGQDLAQQACDPASPWYSAQAASWFAAVLGTAYAGPAAGPVGVAGLPGSPFGYSLVATLNGTGGAGNSTDPDALAATGAGALAQTYRDGTWAAVVSTWGAGRSYFCGYAVESLDAGSATAFLRGFLDWARGLPSGVGSPPADGRLFAAAAAPNPFNPSTTLRFSLAAAAAAQVDICDLRGHRVRRLLQGELPAGAVALVWNGRDDAGADLPSGVYVARIEAAGLVRSVKMVLAK